MLEHLEKKEKNQVKKEKKNARLWWLKTRLVNATACARAPGTEKKKEEKIKNQRGKKKKMQVTLVAEELKKPPHALEPCVGSKKKRGKGKKCKSPHVLEHLYVFGKKERKREREKGSQR